MRTDDEIILGQKTLYDIIICNDNLNSIIMKFANIGKVFIMTVRNPAIVMKEYLAILVVKLGLQ